MRVGVGQAVARVAAIAVLIVAGAAVLFAVAAVAALSTLYMLVAFAGPRPPGMPDLHHDAAVLVAGSAAGWAWIGASSGLPQAVSARTAVTAAVWLAVLAVGCGFSLAAVFSASYLMVLDGHRLPQTVPLLALTVANTALLTLLPPRIAAPILWRLARTRQEP